MSQAKNLHFSARRQHLLSLMQAQGGGVAIIPTARELIRNNDNTFPFRHDSYFYYLSGFTEPDAVIVLIAAGDKQTTILFCREKISNVKSGMAIGLARKQRESNLALTKPTQSMTSMKNARLSRRCTQAIL